MNNVSDSESKRNRTGRQFYRQRLINRAITVAHHSPFRDRIREARKMWNEEYPSLPIRTFESLSELERSDATEVVQGGDEELRVPKGSLDHLTDGRRGSGRLTFRWEALIGDICEEFWPERLFPKMGSFFSPAFKFVEVCMYCEIVHAVTSIEEWIPKFRIALHYLPYEPGGIDHWYHAVMTGERDFWKEMALKAWSELAHQQLPNNFMETSASNAGRRYAREHGVSIMDLYEKPAEEMYWFLPVSPLMSTHDVKSITSRIVEISRMLAGPNYLDDLIMELKAEGQTHAQVDDALGISIDVVKRAVRNRSKGVVTWRYRSAIGQSTRRRKSSERASGRWSLRNRLVQARRRCTNGSTQGGCERHNRDALGSFR
jgi:hypothetical protein